MLNKQLFKNIFSKHLISLFDGKDFVRQKTQDIDKMCYFDIQDKLTAFTRLEYNFLKETYLKKYTVQYTQRNVYMYYIHIYNCMHSLP